MVYQITSESKRSLNGSQKLKHLYEFSRLPYHTVKVKSKIIRYHFSCTRVNTHSSLWFAVFILGLKILPVLYFGLSIFNLLPEQVQLTLAYNNTVKPLVVSPRAADVYDFVFVPNDALLGIKLFGSKLLDKQMVSINNQEILKLYPSSSSGRYVVVIGKSGKIT